MANREDSPFPFRSGRILAGRLPATAKQTKNAAQAARFLALDRDL
jgi:hypothetical protein